MGAPRARPVGSPPVLLESERRANLTGFNGGRACGARIAERQGSPSAKGDAPMIDIASFRVKVRSSRISRARFRAAPLFGAALIGACGGSNPTDEVTQAEDPIQAGQIENGFPAVGRVSSSVGSCSGTLVGPRHVLT